MIIMDAFNFTHGLALMDYTLKAPFLSCMRDLTVRGNWKDPDLTFNLKWLNDKKKDEMEKTFEQNSLNNPNAPQTLASKVSSLSDVFKNFNLDHFKLKINPAFEHAMKQLYLYTANSDRALVLSNTFSRMFEDEKPLYQMLNPTFKDNEQSWKLVKYLQTFLNQEFMVSPKVAEDYLRQSKKDSQAVLKGLVQFDFTTCTLNWVFLLNLLVKWIPKNGIPSFNYYLFNTFLRPYRLKDMESLSTDEPQERPQERGITDDLQHLMDDNAEVQEEPTFPFPLPAFYASAMDQDHIPVIFQNLSLRF